MRKTRTSYAYHNGQSEIALRKGLVERYPRESFEIADKMPTWLLEKEEDNNKYFNEMLERLGIDYFDKFHVHNINVPFLKKAKKSKAFEFVKKMKKEEKIKQIGFSFKRESLSSMLPRLLYYLFYPKRIRFRSLYTPDQLSQ